MKAILAMLTLAAALYVASTIDTAAHPPSFVDNADAMSLPGWP